MLQSPHLQINLASFTHLFCPAISLLPLLLAYLLYAATIVYFYQYIIHHCANYFPPRWTSLNSQDHLPHTLPHECLHCYWMLPPADNMFIIDLDQGHTSKRASSTTSTLPSRSPSPKLWYVEPGQLPTATTLELEKVLRLLSFLWLCVPPDRITASTGLYSAYADISMFSRYCLVCYFPL